MAGQPLASPRCLFMLGRRGHPQLVSDPLRAVGQAGIPFARQYQQ